MTNPREGAVPYDVLGVSGAVLCFVHCATTRVIVLVPLVPTEGTELWLTLLGAVLIAAAHLWNLRLCRIPVPSRPPPA